MTRIKVSVMVIILMASLLLSVQAAVDEHTIAVWFFNEGSGDTVSDSSGNGHDGVFDGNPKWIDAEHGGGLRFPDSFGVPDPRILFWPTNVLCNHKDLPRPINVICPYT